MEVDFSQLKTDMKNKIYATVLPKLSSSNELIAFNQIFGSGNDFEFSDDEKVFFKKDINTADNDYDTCDEDDRSTGCRCWDVNSITT